MSVESPTGKRSQVALTLALLLLCVLGGLLLWQLVRLNENFATHNRHLRALERTQPHTVLPLVGEIHQNVVPSLHASWMELKGINSEFKKLRETLEKRPANAPDKSITKDMLTSGTQDQPWEQGSQPTWVFVADGKFNVRSLPLKVRNQIGQWGVQKTGVITGSWRLSQDGFTLHLTDMRLDRKKKPVPAISFPVAIVGRMYLNIGEYQYFIGDRKLPDK